jgi:exodeoxyribonuclease VII small subunit
MPKTEKSAKPKDFESAIQELEQVVADMESGKLSLEASLVAYKRGMELSTFCQKTLEEAEQQVQILEKGILKDFDPDKDRSRGNQDD